jgi:hypothetical protein
MNSEQKQAVYGLGVYGLLTLISMVFGATILTKLSGIVALFMVLSFITMSTLTFLLLLGLIYQEPEGSDE